jgi:hypothetical protein
MKVTFFHEAPAGIEPKPHRIESHRFKRIGVLKKGAIIASVKFTKGVGETKVNVNPDIFVAPAFDKTMPRILAGIEPLRVLKDAKTYIETVVIPELKGFL